MVKKMIKVANTVYYKTEKRILNFIDNKERNYRLFFQRHDLQKAYNVSRPARSIQSILYSYKEN